MSRSRYEPVPQRDEVINLDSMTSIAGYNYNSGVPNSVPSSVAPSYYGDNPRSNTAHFAAPSIRSIPTSPPPSFHTHSSPGTPRPTPSTTGASEAAELWGVAPSTTGTDASSSPLAIISALQTRVNQLEETIGKLLLEKDELRAGRIGAEEYKGGNCCMTFTDASKSLEEGMSAAGGNCCIRFGSSRKDEATLEQQKRKWIIGGILGIVLIGCTMTVFLELVRRIYANKGPMGEEGVAAGLKAD